MIEQIGQHKLVKWYPIRGKRSWYCPTCDAHTEQVADGSGGKTRLCCACSDVIENPNKKELKVRKPFNHLPGYVSSRVNRLSDGHTVIFDCKKAADLGEPLVEDYVAEGGRYQITCARHGYLVYSSDLSAARVEMEDPADFCMVCRAIENPTMDVHGPTLGLRDDEIISVQIRRNKLYGKKANR